jgi:hypothetical protein
MIPTYTYKIKENIIKNYLGANLVVALINNASLGITDTPTNQELESRRNFSSSNLFNFEIGSSSLNGYARAIIDNSSISTDIVNAQVTETNLTATFTAFGGSFEPFTHIVVIRGANLSNANPELNGNNRGDTTGTIIFIEPVENPINPGSPLTLNNGVSYNYNFKLVSASQVI